jgi:uncharacterized protein YbjQ (UPF0145 family)
MMIKEIESVKTNNSIISDKYLSFQKEKEVFQTERDQANQQIKELEEMIRSAQDKTMEDINIFKT